MCPSDGELIRLLSGEVPEDARALIQSHLVSCDVCRQRHASLRATWEMLGQWQPLAPSGDLTGAVLARAAAPQARPAWARVSAAIVLAAGAGAAAGLLAPVPSWRAAAVGLSSVQQVVDELGLDALADPHAPMALLLESGNEHAAEEPS